MQGVELESRCCTRGDRVERARLYKAANETCFGVQIATKTIEDGIKAAHLAQEAGARWVDINCGCPIYGTHTSLWACSLLQHGADVCLHICKELFMQPGGETCRRLALTWLYSLACQL